MVTWSTRPALSYSTFKIYMFLNGFLSQKSCGAPSLVHPFLSAVHVVSNDTAQQHEVLLLNVHGTALFCAFTSNVCNWQRCIVCVHIEEACVDFCFGAEAVPMSSASSGPTKRPVKIISLDLLLPIKRGSRWVPPALQVHQAKAFFKKPICALLCVIICANKHIVQHHVLQAICIYMRLLVSYALDIKQTGLCTTPRITFANWL